MHGREKEGQLKYIANISYLVGNNYPQHPPLPFPSHSANYFPTFLISARTLTANCYFSPEKRGAVVKSNNGPKGEEDSERKNWYGLSREEWLKDGENCEETHSNLTSLFNLSLEKAKSRKRHSEQWSDKSTLQLRVDSGTDGGFVRGENVFERQMDWRKKRVCLCSFLVLWGSKSTLMWYRHSPPGSDLQFNSLAHT